MLRRDFLKYLGLAALTVPLIGHEAIIPNLLPEIVIPKTISLLTEHDCYTYVKFLENVSIFKIVAIRGGEAPLCNSFDGLSFLGVAEHNFLAGEYGWVRIGGTTRVMAVTIRGTEARIIPDDLGL